MIGGFVRKKLGRRKPTPEELEDYRASFRYGIFDNSGYVRDMKVSNSKKEFASLDIDPKTKPFKYPLDDGGYIDVYLMGNEILNKLYSHDQIWLSADLCYSNFELSGSLIGKLAEIYQRVGEIKNGLGDDFSLRANLFLVLMTIFGGIACFYFVGKLIFH